MKKLLLILSLLLMVLLLYFIINIVEKDYRKLPSEKEHIFFAHRGLPYLAENSDQSFRESRVVGFSALETDIQFTKDHKLMQ